MDEENNIKKLNIKLNSLSTGKKLGIIVLGILIIIMLMYITSIDKIETVNYEQHGKVLCTETYINGNLNTSPCPQNTIYFPQEKEWLTSGINYKNLT